MYQEISIFNKNNLEIQSRMNYKMGHIALNSQKVKIQKHCVEKLSNPLLLPQKLRVRDVGLLIKSNSLIISRC